ncbi:hypothetical protein SLS53_005569 [Cytospora paraplurivora]|uniref:Methyltransferase n=1 Tax=Cytospora paraplurivora TaxID=2898453 RepID=A0AAN9YFZ6_9PEZI
MLSKLSHAFPFRAAPVGIRVVAVKRGHATATHGPSLNAGVPPPVTWTKTQPFEHGPWLRPGRTKGTIRFLGPTLDGKPAFLNFKKGQEHQTNFGPSLERVVDITDLRNFEPRTTLSVEGVDWVHAPSCLSEDRLLRDEGEVEAFVRSRYFDECAALVKERTGAAKAIAYNYRHRRIEQNTNLHDPYKFSGKPLPNFHMDNDAATAEVNLRRVLGDEEASRWLGKSWGIVNVWRPVGDVVRQWPLALVDSRSVVYGRDTQPIYTLNNYKTHFTALKPREHFRFYYVSNLAPDEALLFVDYDSKHAANTGDGHTVVGVAHGAFEDHNAPDKYPRRRSIEVRSLVLYDN